MTNQTFAFHLLGRSANLHSNITSRIANADHHHPFSCEGICIFIFPAVKTPARKGFMPWRNTDFATVTRKNFFQECHDLNTITPRCPFIYLESQTMVMLDGCSDLSTPEWHQRCASLPVRSCLWSLLPIGRIERNPAFAKHSSLWSEVCMPTFTEKYTLISTTLLS